MDKIGLGTANWLVIIVYLIAMLGVGLYFTKKAGKNTDEFFTAGGKIPAWAAGFSIYATTLSAITYMSTPEQAFLTDWSYAAGNIAIFAIIPILIYFYIPFFRKLNVTSAYEYLEVRFGASLRVVGSLLFILFHIGRVAIVVYLPTLAITSVSDINPMLIASIVGILCIIYTFLGGIEGVIWSDVIQGIILLGGAILVIGVGINYINGGFSTIISDALENDKLITAGNFQFGTAAAAIPIIFLGSIFNNLHQYTASQDVVQRYQTTKSMKETNKSLWTNGALALITIPIFYGMGTMLYSYYSNSGGLPEEVNTSAIVPYFIVTTLPAGVAGLLIAAIFAAAQSTISSSLNSISACVITDFKQRFFEKKKGNDVLLARLVVIIAGVLGMTAALYLVSTNRAETWNLFLDITGLFGVPIAAVFALGILTKRANTPGVFIGLGTAAIVAYFVQGTDMTPFAVSMVSFLVSFVVGYLASFVFSDKGKNIKGLTIYTKSEGYADEVSKAE
ncbi:MULTISPECIES: sodium:solute symporter [Oceanobacillus]|uniref:Sodium/glucose cotransporter n=2 Tax=Oceanobacillus TaxID=182709 RepID=A0A0A1MPE5_9BACI|nr:sodium:solute symporter [Oceanobacillus oncorhynchi]MDM8101287.1 sodium:solute symporter [Oceanobacillus oncorhynchi]UUI39424.1 sodium:solute symporter [Oceanobacillus oncorhynchi]CEI80941.1 Sodium/glucose cotransporter [Oceanobacillus oncorhynchi]